MPQIFNAVSLVTKSGIYRLGDKMRILLSICFANWDSTVLFHVIATSKVFIYKKGDFFSIKVR